MTPNKPKKLKFPNGNGGFNTAQWIRDLATTYFPILVALYFMGFFDGFVPTTVGAHHRHLEAQQAEIASIRHTLENSQKIWRQMCLNGAKTELAQAECQR